MPAPEDDETVFGDTLLPQEADEPVTITDVCCEEALQEPVEG